MIFFHLNERFPKVNEEYINVNPTLKNPELMV